jgi:hypothetical protein
MRSFHCRCASLAAVAWLALAVLSALLPAEVQAGCNHPWVTRARHASPTADRTLFVLSDRAATPEPVSSEPAKGPSPCAAGTCSQVPNQPASLPVPVPTRAELWTDFGLARLPVNPASVGFLPDRGRQHPVRIIIPIDRPPRSAFSC